MGKYLKFKIPITGKKTCKHVQALSFTAGGNAKW